MARSLLMATVYVTEAAFKPKIAHLQRILDGVIERVKPSLPSEPLKLVHLATFSDEPYKRTSFSVGGEPEEVETAVLSVARTALRTCPLSPAGPSTTEHPRLGAVDHISVFPLRPLNNDTRRLAGESARRIGRTLAGRDCGSLPVYFYGFSSVTDGGATLAEARKLRDIRRALGYFSAAEADPLAWLRDSSIPLPLVPDLPLVDSATKINADPAVGVCCVGAADHVLNYNVQVSVSAPSPAALTAATEECKRIARTIAERSPDGKGLKGVEALALPYSGSAAAETIIEIACNLLDTKTTPPEAVLERVKAEVDASNERSAPAGFSLRVGHAYQIGLTPQQALEKLGEPAA